MQSACTSKVVPSTLPRVGKQFEDIPFLQPSLSAYLANRVMSTTNFATHSLPLAFALRARTQNTRLDQLKIYTNAETFEEDLQRQTQENI